MKATLLRVKRGDRLRARILELQAGGDILISFDGDILRVRNETNRALRVGQVVTVFVIETSPLRFQLASERRTGHLDVNV